MQNCLQSLSLAQKPVRFSVDGADWIGRGILTNLTHSPAPLKKLTLAHPMESLEIGLRQILKAHPELEILHIRPRRPWEQLPILSSSVDATSQSLPKVRKLVLEPSHQDTDFSFPIDALDWSLIMSLRLDHVSAFDFLSRVGVNQLSNMESFTTHECETNGSSDANLRRQTQGQINELLLRTRKLRSFTFIGRAQDDLWLPALRRHGHTLSSLKMHLHDPQEERDPGDFTTHAMFKFDDIRSLVDHFPKLMELTLDLQLTEGMEFCREWCKVSTAFIVSTMSLLYICRQPKDNIPTKHTLYRS